MDAVDRFVAQWSGTLSPEDVVVMSDVAHVLRVAQLVNVRIDALAGFTFDGRLTLSVRIPVGMAGRVRVQTRLPGAVARALRRTSVRLTRTARPTVVVVLGRPSRPVRPQDVRGAVAVRVLALG